MATGVAAWAADTTSSATPPSTYSDDEIIKQANNFFATGAKGLSDVLAKVLKEKGQPVAFIRGEEAGGAVAVGVRYGHGELVFKDGRHRTVYWQGPSLGFDIGADAVKAFVLVYNLCRGIWRELRAIRCDRTGAGALWHRLAAGH
jgi:hypothetical protein